MKNTVAGMLVGSGLALLLGMGASPVWAETPVSACGTLAGGNSYIVTADLVSTGGDCLTVTGSGAAINLNGHSIRGVRGSGTGINATAGTNPGNNMTITGPGIVHDFDTCISLGKHALVQNVLAYNCEITGIKLGNFSKCVECRVHDIRSSEVNGVGISIGLGCLLESSIVSTSDIGARVGNDCKVWDLVVDGVSERGLVVGTGTSVARTVISHYHDGPGLDYTACTTGAVPPDDANGCQDSSNSVTLTTGGGTAIDDSGAVVVVTDCATNAAGDRYQGKPTTQCGG